MPLRRRAVLLLEECIASLEGMDSGNEPLESRKLGRWFSDLRSLQRSIVKLERTGAKSRHQFWKMQRRAAILIVRIAKHLSTS
jgi:hypothetical protein